MYCPFCRHEETKVIDSRLAGDGLRRALFNRSSVRLVWLPLFAAAERSRHVARIVHENMYRGGVVHYFIRGFREACRQYGSLPLSRSAEGG